MSATTPASPHPPRKTPLYEAHRRAGAKIIDFGGWLMPVSYPSGIIDEHRATRSAVGVFDVSHMGEVHFRGPRAAEAVQRLVTNDVAKLVDGHALYTVACRPTGGIVDDFIVYRITGEHFLIVVNAGNREKDVAWFRENVGTWCEITDASDETALIAFQGPKAEAALQTLTAAPLSSVRSFDVVPELDIAGVRASIARTGYTAEDGFEIFCAAGDASGALGSPARDRRDDRRQAGRPRRARHAEARGQALPLRQRPDRGDHAARGRARLGGQARRRRLHRQDRAARAEGERRRAQAGRAS